MATCNGEGPFGLLTKRFADICQTEDETRAPFGVDPAFVKGSRSFRQTNIDLNRTATLFGPGELSDNGMPYGFFYSMGSATGKGYPVLLDVNANVSRANQLLDILEDGGYLDSATDTVKAQIVLLNIEDGSIIMLTITAQSQAKGSVSFEHELTFVDPSPYESTADWFRFALELVFLGLLAGLLCQEAAEMWPSPTAYFRDVYNLTDLLGYGLRIVMVVVWVDLAGSCTNFSSKPHYQVFADRLATARVLGLNDEIGELQQVMAQLESIVEKVTSYEQLCTISIVVMVVQLTQKLNFHPRMGMISRTVHAALEDLVFFFIILGLVVFSFAYLGCLLYGERSTPA